MKFQIQLHLHPSSVGGRKFPIPNGFRCDWRLSFVQSDLNCARVTMEHPEICPGETREVLLEPLVEALWKDVQPGQQLGMHEGPKQIGIAQVLEVRN